MTRFLLAENPIHPDQSGVWVVHLRDPRAIIQCIEGHVETEAPFAHFTYEGEEWTLSAYHFSTTDFISEPEDQVQPLLKKAWRWYRAYLEWQHEKH